jgi:hypothetical protein
VDEFVSGYFFMRYVEKEQSPRQLQAGICPHRAFPAQKAQARASSQCVRAADDSGFNFPSQK